MSTVEVNTSDLVGPALEWATAKSEGLDPQFFPVARDRYDVCTIEKFENGTLGGVVLRYSTEWCQGGPLIERERISLTGPGCMGAADPGKTWSAYIDTGSFGGGQSFFGPSPLIAACRTIVAAKLGDTVQVPEELMP